MCGRFSMTLPSDAMASLFAASPANDLPDVPNYNVCPTNQVMSVVAGENGRKLQSHRWGFIPHWYKKPNDGPLLINARGETIAEKPAFRAACRERRCLIPASGFYEWTKGKDGARLPWYIAPAAEPMVFAGIWQVWGEMTTCAIVTVAAGEGMREIHHREPVTLAPDQWGTWLGEGGKAATLMEPAPEGAMSFWRVSRDVNSNRASGADLIEPWDGD